jgi:hypothetical protein
MEVFVLVFVLLFALLFRAIPFLVFCLGLIALFDRLTPGRELRTPNPSYALPRKDPLIVIHVVLTELRYTPSARLSLANRSFTN